MDIELATFEQLLEELGKRFDTGLVVVGLRDTAGDDRAEDFMVYSTGGPTVTMGLLYRALAETERDARLGARRKKGSDL